MNELRRIFRNQLRALVGLAALGGLVHLQVAHADGLADPAFNRFRSQVTGNQVNFSYGSGGTPLGGASNATGIGVSSGVDVSRGVSIATKHGPINGTLSQKISGAAMGRAFARAGAFLGGPIGLAFLALPSIVDWMDEAGVKHDGSGFTALSELPAGYDGYEYREQNVTGTTWYKTRQAACTAYAANTYGGPSSYYTCLGPNPSNWLYFQVQLRNSSNGSVINTQDRLYSRRVDPSPPVQVQEPITSEQLEQRMGSVTNPSPEALAELYKLGEFHMPAHPVPDLVDTIRADLEARSPESTETSTTETPTETKTEQKTCATYTQVSGSTVGLVEQCTTTTTTQEKDPETGAPIGDPKVETSTSTSSTPDPATKEEAEDPCANAPDRMMCVKLGAPEGEIPKSTQTVSYTPEVLFGSGTCPPDQTVVIHGMSLKLTDMPRACNLLATYVKPIAILLAAFTALMIVAVGVPE